MGNEGLVDLTHRWATGQAASLRHNATLEAVNGIMSFVSTEWKARPHDLDNTCHLTLVSDNQTRRFKTIWFFFVVFFFKMWLECLIPKMSVNVPLMSGLSIKCIYVDDDYSSSVFRWMLSCLLSTNLLAVYVNYSFGKGVMLMQTLWAGGPRPPRMAKQSCRLLWADSTCLSFHTLIMGDCLS